jgi:pimeloyl-ACP methyl ester carboxylesterase
MAWLPLFTNDGSPSPLGALQLTAILQCLQVNDLPRARQIVEVIGGGNLLAWQFQPDTWPPSWTAWSSGSDRYIILAGTSNAAQWMGHLAGVYGVDYPGFPNVVAHGMFLIAWLAGIRPPLLAVLGPLMGLRVHLFGHSYGGAVAFLGALDLARTGGAAEVECLTIGQARALSPGYNGVLPARYARLAGVLDPVPRLPCDQALTLLNPFAAVFSRELNWSHYGDGWGVNANSSGPFANISTSAAEAALILATGQAATHFASNYTACCAAWSQRANEPAEPRAAISAITATLPAVPSVQSDNVLIPPSSVTSPAQANSVYFGGASVATSANLDTGFGPAVLGAAAALVLGPAISLGGRDMAIWRMKVAFSYGNWGWEEQYWCDAATPTAPLFHTPGEIAKLLAPRPPGTKLLSFAAYAPFATAAGAINVINIAKPGVPVPTSTTADPGGVVLYGLISTASGRARKLAIKVWTDGSVAFDVSGEPVFNGAVMGMLNDYASVLRASPAYGIAYQSGRNTPAGRRFKVLQITQDGPGVAGIHLTPADYTLLVAQLPYQQVTFTGRDKSTLVALKGSFAVLSQTSPTIQIPYQLPGGAQSWTPTKLFVHGITLNFTPFVGNIAPVDWRTRKIGRKKSLTRGRASKQLSRT